MKITDYERDTVNAYRSAERASAYKRFHTTEWNWGRFATWMEQRAIGNELARHSWSSSDQLLDVPCGTGILGKLVQRFPFRIVAADISMEMIAMATAEYPRDRLALITQTDITNMPFARESFACIVTLGFLHRVPLEIKRATLRELASLSNRLVIITCSVDTPMQRFKYALLSWVKRNYAPAPCPMPLRDIIAECESHGFQVLRAFMAVPMLSANAILVLSKSLKPR